MSNECNSYTHLLSKLKGSGTPSISTIGIIQRSFETFGWLDIHVCQAICNWCSQYWNRSAHRSRQVNADSCHPFSPFLTLRSWAWKLVYSTVTVRQNSSTEISSQLKKSVFMRYSTILYTKTRSNSFNTGSISIKTFTHSIVWKLGLAIRLQRPQCTSFCQYQVLYCRFKLYKC